MRVFIVLAAIAFTHGAKLERTYLPPISAGSAGGSGNFLQAPPSSGISGKSLSYNQDTSFSQSGNGNGFSQAGNDFAQSGNDYSQSGNGLNYNFRNQGRLERPRAALERNAAILRLENSNDGETYSYAYETENGITAEESGVATSGVEAQGRYSYTGDDGQVYSVRYTADQNGFVPQGDHLPTPPPVPEEILKALEQNARDEAAGIFDDGSYNEGKYSGAENNVYNYQQENAYNSYSEDTNSALARSGNARSYIPPAYNADTGLAPTYGAPAQNAPAFEAARTIAPTYGAPAFTGNRNAPSTTANNAPTLARTAGARNSATEKAYLPPSAGQREQNRNVFGRRQQSFDARTGYNY